MRHELRHSKGHVAEGVPCETFLLRQIYILMLKKFNAVWVI